MKMKVCCKDSMYQMLERKQHDVGVMLDGHASRLGAQKVGPKAGCMAIVACDVAAGHLYEVGGCG